MKTQWLILQIAIALIVTLTACSGQSVPAQPKLTPVTLQLQWVTQAQFAGYYVALDKGWYKDEGIDLTIIPGGPDVSPLDLVASGTRDFGTSLLADLAVAVQGNKPVIGIAQIQQKNGLLLIAKKSSGILSPADLKGKKVGVWLGSWEAQFDALTAKEGISKNDFTLVQQGYSMTPFIKGDLDVASAMSYNEYYSVLESGIAPEDINIIDYANYGLDFPGDVLFTSKTTVDQNPDLCTRMVRASLKGWQYAIAHPSEAVDIVLRYDKTGEQTRQHQLSMMTEIAKLVQGPQLGRSDDAALQRTIDTLLQFGILKGAVQPADVMTNKFWDSASK
ncbi:MAG: ABC transporter substrate-binding protein [Chloroflexi bacterium]|nr:ABC transporter substrate-binding protein [Chloroflexota bacterium]